LINAPFAESLGRRAQELVAQQMGAADRTIELLQRLARAEQKQVKAA
jgi:hypothetical protein